MFNLYNNEPRYWRKLRKQWRGKPTLRDWIEWTVLALTVGPVALLLLAGLVLAVLDHHLVDVLLYFACPIGAVCLFIWLDYEHGDVMWGWIGAVVSLALSATSWIVVTWAGYTWSTAMGGHLVGIAGAILCGLTIAPLAAVVVLAIGGNFRS
jgi:hypothetical protein